tara:strand:+ start:69 stop:518 length:450 start_codon:yes stop_codon:yes gene_type:complete
MTHTVITTINNKKILIEVSTDNKIETQEVTFTSKLSTTNYIDRLRKKTVKQIDKDTGKVTLPEITTPLCIIDTIRNITTKHNFSNKSSNNSKSKEKRLKTDNLRFIPPSLVTCIKSNKDIKKERIKEILMDIEMGNFKNVENKVKQYFG